ncbi:sigma 54-interacting transcriptional regulator [Sporosarcina sp. ACRSM]|uniref:sigma-54 interaction domain-containing protein n=1 Tax=Sporosarcina sp. ACRSM TaxID=2918216 RepID=UPI001EF65DEC|nr:sigma 54-interacting transcriptional regulator [Sporosarcina sp. ACRSM]MCG7333816.1 sigma 54-interacting transcriptional regulator [Sporosarcina sp. ACRSM]
MISEQFFNHQLLDIVFESANYGTVIVDRNGKIQYMSNQYCEFLEVNREDVVGEYVANLIENTRMHLVVQTGQSEMADLQFLRGSFVIANRIPIIENKEIIGAIGTILFRDLHDWKEMNNNIKELLARNNLYHPEDEPMNGINYTLHDLKGNSKAILELKERIKRIAEGDISILVRGESGTGKEIIAQSIHQLSSRSQKRFVSVNCGAIPEHLIESELFGYEEGAFTGAKKGGKIGKFQLADGGTLFLDEIGDMPLHMQVKMLRVLQEGEVEPVGSLQSQKVDVRIVAATNRPLEKMIENREFREDLFYRINAVQLMVPPLRERTEDIPMLVQHFLEKITSRIGKRVQCVQQDVLALFQRYNWPGNIRELENVLNAGVHLAQDSLIRMPDLPDYLTKEAVDIQKKTLKEIVEETEKQAIEQALKNSQYDRNKAAMMLGIGNSTIYEKIKKYQLID